MQNNAVILALLLALFAAVFTGPLLFVPHNKPRAKLEMVVCLS